MGSPIPNAGNPIVSPDSCQRLGVLPRRGTPRLCRSGAALATTGVRPDFLWLLDISDPSREPVMLNGQQSRPTT